MNKLKAKLHSVEVGWHPQVSVCLGVHHRQLGMIDSIRQIIFRPVTGTIVFCFANILDTLRVLQHTHDIVGLTMDIFEHAAETEISF